MASEEILPKRTCQHTTGDRAVRVFGFRCRNEWALNKSESDYGWDLIVTLEKNSYVKEHLFIQIKGSDCPEYLKKTHVISFSWETKTINFLSSQPLPALLCLCDTGKSEEPIYYIWVEEVITELDKRKPDWKKHEEVNVHIPLANAFNKDACLEIETHVRNFYTINAAMKSTLLPAFGGQDFIQELYSSDEPGTLLFQRTVPLQKAGLIDIVEDGDEKRLEALSPEDQERSQKLQHISRLLTDLQDKNAERLLSELSDELEQASDGVRAAYYNARGIVSLRKGEYESPIHAFRVAHELRPQERKYTLNLLLAQQIAADQEGSLPDDWKERLDALLSEDSGDCHALRLKASWIARQDSPEEAEAFLRDSPCWEKEPAFCGAYLAAIYHAAGDLANAERLLKEAESSGIEADINFWSLYGNILLKKAFGIYEPASEFVVNGSGPSDLDIETLRQAEKCLQKAFELLQAKGFPYQSLQVVGNYAVTLRLLGDLEKEERICKIYLAHEPQDPTINAALASCLAIQHKTHKAIAHARIAYTHSNDTSNYKLLMICYFNVEAYDELLRLIAERQKYGFDNKEEEGFSLMSSAIAYNEIGEYDYAARILKQLQSDPELAKDAVFAEVGIAKKSNEPRETIVRLYQAALKNYPENLRILLHYLDELQPVSGHNAAEIIRCIKIIELQTQLSPRLIYQFEQAYIQQENFESADELLESGFERYPNEPGFLYERAKVQVGLGDEEHAFQLLQQYIEIGQSSYTVLHNLAWLASETDRVDQAIELFERLLSKVSEKSLRGAIHCQLRELRKQRGDGRKQILRHVVEFGKTVEDVEQEAKFLKLFISTMFGPAWNEDEYDAEVRAWNKEVKERFSKFSEEYPDFLGLKMFEIPDTLPKAEYIFHIQVQLALARLPHELASTPLKIAARSKRYPLSFRTQYSNHGNFIFDYWTYCTGSKSFEHAIHIRHSWNIYEQEKKAVAHSKAAVCIDITALLTLAELDLLDALAKSFDRIFITRGTKNALRGELKNQDGPHPLAQKIEDWRLENRRLIRIPPIEILDEEQEDSFAKSAGGIFLRKVHSPESILRDEIGDSLLLAKKLGIALYSDESAIGQSASQDLGIASFCSIAFFEHLREEGYISIEREATLLAEMISKNFEIVPFSIDHLNCLLKKVWEEAQSEGKPFSRNNLMQHDVMGVFMRQFGEGTILEEKLIEIAISWWQTILVNGKFERNVLVKCMIGPVFCLSMRTKSGVLTDVERAEKEAKTVLILTRFLWATYRNHTEYTHEAWLCIKDCVQELYYNSQHHYQRILFSLIPNLLYRIARSDSSLREKKWLDLLIQLPLHFSQEDRDRFERVLAPKVM